MRIDETLQSIMDTHPDLIARYDADFNFTYVNRSFAQFLRTTEAELLGTNVIERAPPGDGEPLLNEFRSLTPDNPAHVKTLRIEREGQVYHLLWTNIALFEAGKLIGHQSVGRDISNRIRLERQLKARGRELENIQEELRFVLDSVPSMIWYKDDANKILRLNQSAADSMNMRVEDVEGQNTYDLFGDAAKSYHEADLQVLNSGEALKGYVEPYTPNDGDQGWVQTDKIPLDNVDGDRRLLVVATDITELKEQEAILKTINKNLDDFGSLVSHDLQAPLRKIGISTELMQMEFGDMLPKGSEAYLKDISKSVDHMRQMILHFLAFMRQSPAGVRLEPLNLSSLLSDIVEEERDTLAAIGGQVTVPQAEIIVKGDESLLRQVFSNLVQNAIKYRSNDRTLKLEFSVAPKNQFWDIFVTDNGSGVDATQAAHIFDLFGRAKPHSGIEGSGIGLALCRKILTLHGGSIMLAEIVGPGSCFHLQLYRAKA